MLSAERSEVGAYDCEYQCLSSTSRWMDVNSTNGSKEVIQLLVRPIIVDSPLVEGADFVDLTRMYHDVTRRFSESYVHVLFDM